MRFYRLQMGQIIYVYCFFLAISSAFELASSRLSETQNSPVFCALAFEGLTPTELMGSASMQSIVCSFTSFFG